MQTVLSMLKVIRHSLAIGCAVDCGLVLLPSHFDSISNRYISFAYVLDAVTGLTKLTASPQQQHGTYKSKINQYLIDMFA